MNRYECSVIVIQYNPVWEKIKRTLQSIVNQQDCTYEIIIADDGSKDPYFGKTKDFLEQCGIVDYKIVANTKNQGTVKNVISGIENASGKYVRVIAPGDMLYSDNTLRYIVDEMELHGAKEAFGKMVFFSEEEDELIIHSNCVPYDLEPYKKKEINKIKNRLTILGDNISGASYTWERLYYLECLNIIKDKVIFLEDCLSLCTVYDENDILFLEDFVTWYEFGTGISTSKKNKWTEILAKDWISYFEIMSEKYNDKRVQRGKRYYQMCFSGSLFQKVKRNILFLDRYLYSKLMKKEYSVDELNRIEKKNIRKYLGVI